MATTMSTTISPWSRGRNLAQCDSWSGVSYGYIVRPEVGPFARVKRTNEYMGKLE